MDVHAGIRAELSENLRTQPLYGCSLTVKAASAEASPQHEAEKQRVPSKGSETPRHAAFTTIGQSETKGSPVGLANSEAKPDEQGANGEL